MLWTLVGLVAFIIFLLLTYASVIELRWYDITHPEITMKHLPNAFDGYRIAHITDIHMDSSMTRERLQEVAEMVNEQQPDLIIITGDFVSYEVEGTEDDLYQALSDFSAPDGILAVMGNHDHLSGVDTVRRVLGKVSIQELENDWTTIERNGQKLYFVGVDSISGKEVNLGQALDDLPVTDKSAILLAHEPDFADIASAKNRFALQLSGHTHGGQVQFPFYGAMYGPEHGHIYSDGLYDVTDDMQIYVSRGVGTVMAPIRFNCRPEITVLTLRQSA